MRKFFICMILGSLSICNSFAQTLKLSDVIENARKAELMRMQQTIKNEEAIQPVKNETPVKSGEQSACEKINSQEIINSAQKTGKK